MPGERVQRMISGLLDEAEQAAVARDWITVLARAQAALTLDPSDEDALAFAAAANRVSLLDGPPALGGDARPLGGEESAHVRLEKGEHSNARETVQSHPYRADAAATGPRNGSRRPTGGTTPTFSLQRSSRTAVAQKLMGIFGILVLAGLVAIGLLGLLKVYQSVKGDGSSATSNSQAAPTSLPKQQPRIGDAFEAPKDGWTLKVTDVRTEGAWLVGILSLPKLAQGTYLILNVELTNTANSAHALGKNRFTLHDGSGRNFEAAFLQDQLLTDISFGRDVPAGVTTALTIGFDVPTTASSLWLETIAKGHIALGSLQDGNFTQELAPVPTASAAFATVSPSPLATPPPPTSRALSTVASPTSATQDVTGTWNMVDTVTSGTDSGRRIEFTLQLQQAGEIVTGSTPGLALTGRRTGNVIHLDFTRTGSTGYFEWTVQLDGSLSGRYEDVGNGGTSSGVKRR